jgi:hypothetical protein
MVSRKLAFVKLNLRKMPRGKETSRKNGLRFKSGLSLWRAKLVSGGSAG